MIAESGLDLVWCPFPDRAAADAAARNLIDDGLAVCVHVLPPMTSYFRWQGAVQQSQEVAILCKVGAGRAPQVRQRLHELHSYDLPAIVSWTGACSPALASWAADV